MRLGINDRAVAGGEIKDMIWTPAEVIAHLPTPFEIGVGDLIHPGTPRGTGQIQAGDVLLARSDGPSDLRIPIAGA